MAGVAGTTTLPENCGSIDYDEFVSDALSEFEVTFAEDGSVASVTDFRGQDAEFVGFWFATDDQCDLIDEVIRESVTRLYDATLGCAN